MARMTLTLTILLTWSAISPAPAVTPPSSESEPWGGILLGAHVGPSADEQERRDALEARERHLGRIFDLDHHVYGWSDPFPTSAEPWDLARGRTPLVTWGGTNTFAVVAGVHDPLIRARASALAALGRPVLLRWFPEIDRSPASDGPLDRVAFIVAWRRLHAIFSEEGAENVRWVWCPSAEGFDTGVAPALYPGDDVVDWVCASGYNHAPGSAPGGRSFEEIFQAFREWGRVLEKPLMIGETGTAEGSPGEKADWIGSAAATLRSWYPDVRALVYTDAPGSEDWRVDTSASSLQAFTEMAQEPAFMSGALFGAYVKPETGWFQQDVQGEISRTEADLGRTLDIDHHFYPPGIPFPTWREPWDTAHGRLSLITWGAASTADVVSGAMDAEARARARGLAALGTPVLLRWFAEMERPPVRPTAGPPSRYVSAWQRLHSIFEQEGADNVSWVWCPTAWGFSDGSALPYYPGDEYVDWVCADGYNWSPGKPEVPWRTFDSIFRDFYAWASRTGKPIMIGETGTEEGPVGAKADWFEAIPASLASDYPLVEAFVYFDSLKPEADRTYDWRYDSSPGARDAFRTLAHDPHFGGI